MSRAEEEKEGVREGAGRSSAKESRAAVDTGAENGAQTAKEMDRRETLTQRDVKKASESETLSSGSGERQREG